MNRLPYPSDLNDDEWELLKPLILIHQGVGHPQTVELRKLSMPFCIGQITASNGELCLMIFHLGQLYTITIDAGSKQESGKK